MTKETGKLIIEQKVQDFEKNAVVLKKKGHGETNIRSNYIDVLFEALGWDMKSHYEVDREFSQKDTSGTKKVDYAFKLNGKTKFFIEAKEASVDLVNNKDAIHQAKRYAYSTNGKAPIVILTDFEEFRVFNVMKAPVYDNPNRELLPKYSMEYTDYINNWDLLWDTFSKEAVGNGSLDALRGKLDKNTKTMDVDFLEQITGWRETLARNIAIRNKELKVEELNEAVQRILDRFLFIRNLEDREIEPENLLLEKTKSTNGIYKSIIPIFRNLDTVYNGLMFKKHFSEDLLIDDKTIKDIIKNMCYPVSPFQFDVIEPEILGRIYEKFLGSKIRLTENHQAKVEEKIEVRKAGGVYYTPEYIVNYIVENTVGKKIEGLTPEEIKKIKIVDPACGSGSFLLGAYSYILAYHEKWYSAHKTDKAYKNDFYITKGGELKVNLDKRGDILRNNLFGVDIDQEATEVAIMSLYLKMLDDGFDKGAKDLFFIKGHVLPDMTNNIKCGNSLIETDYFDGRLEFTHDEFIKIKPFDWDKEFANIFQNGGFDCVIGNPPYLNMTLASVEKSIFEYYQKKYNTIRIGGSKNLFQLFIDKFIDLNPKCLSFIIPESLISTLSNGLTREKILTNFNLSSVVYFDHFVFQDATIGTIIIVLENRKEYSTNVFKIDNNHDINLTTNLELTPSISAWDIKLNVLDSKVTGKICANGVLMKELVTMSKGMAVKDRNQKLLSEKIENFLPFVLGKNMNRYQLAYDKYANYQELNIVGGTRDLSKHISIPRILIRRTGKIICATYSENPELIESTLYILKTEKINYHLLLGILNSNLLTYYLSNKLVTNSQGFPQILMSQLEQLPIHIPEISNLSESKICGNIISLVDNMLQTQKDSRTAKSESDKSMYAKKVNMLDNQINQLVYKLYDLTEEEIKIVEN